MTRSRGLDEGAMRPISPREMRIIRALPVAILLMVACGDDGGSPPDARVADARVADAPAADAAADGAMPDATVADAEAADAPAVDAATPDAPTDAAADAATPDAPTDAAPDATPDAVPPDAPGVDAGPSVPQPPPTGLCHERWCWVYPLPQGDALGGVWGASADDVWFTASDALLRLRAGIWSEHRPGGSFLRVWGTSADDVWATGTGIYHWDGASWSLSSATATSIIGGTGRDDVWAYARTTASLVHWNGATWTPHPLPAAGWEPIAFGGSPGAALLVAKSGGIARWSGTAWTIVEPAASLNASDAQVIDSTHVVLLRSAGIARWSGSGWTTTPLPASATAIAARTFDDVWVIGRRAFHWDGQTVSEVPYTLHGIGTAGTLWVDPAGRPWRITSSAEVGVWNGTAWEQRTFGHNDYAYTGGSADDDVWLLPRDAGDVLRWNGTSWTRIHFPLDNPGPWWRLQLGPMVAFAPDDVFVTTFEYTQESPFEARASVLHWDGAAWTWTYDPPWVETAGGSGLAIWASARDDIYVVNEDGLIHFDGATWSRVAAVPAGDVVFGTSRSDVYVLQQPQLGNTTVWHWNGATWLSTLAPARVDKAWVNSATDIWFAGTAAVHYDGVSFTVVDPHMTHAVFGTATDMVAHTFIRNEGRFWTRWDGGAGSTPTRTPASPVVPQGLWRSPSGAIYAASSGLRRFQP